MKRIVNKHTIFQLCLMLIFIAYGLAEIIYQCIFFTLDSIIEIIISLIICTTFSLIMYFSIKISTPSKKTKDTKELDEDKKELEEKPEKNIHCYENKRGKVNNWFYEHFVINLKNFLIGLGILVLFGGAGSGVVWFASTRIAKLNGENYIKTVATIGYVTYHTNDDPELDEPYTRIQYIFHDENGNQIVSDGDAELAGLTLRVGNKVTIYYNKYKPEIITTTATPIMLFLCGGFFIACSLLAFISLFDVRQKFSRGTTIAIFFGAIFAGFGFTFFAGVHAAGGDSFIHLVLGLGGGGYAVGCFTICGCAFILIGIFGILNSIFKSLKQRRNS